MKSSGFSSSLSPWNGVMTSAAISSESVGTGERFGVVCEIGLLENGVLALLDRGVGTMNSKVESREEALV